MNIDPQVTIVTPSFNQGQFIDKTIRSVLNQTYKNIQYIIIDGGSTDNSMDIVNKYRDKIDIIIHEQDKGQADGINKGFKLAKGELVGWINSDDFLYPDCVEKIVELYKNKPDGAIFYGSIIDCIDENSKIFKSIVREIPNRKYLLNKDYSIIQQGSFYPIGFVKKCNYLDRNLYYCMDLKLWLDLSEYGPIYSYRDKPLAAFRFWGKSKTTNAGYMFVREIRNTLLDHGVNHLSRNIMRTLWYESKALLKKAIIKTK